MSQLITPKLAILAKKLGFNLPCKYYVSAFFKTPVAFFSPLDANNLTTWSDKVSKIISANLTSVPTQSEFRSWLRKEYSININITHRPHSQKYAFTITGSYHKGNDGKLYEEAFGKYETYEIALEEALYQALKLIKNAQTEN